MIHSGHTSTFTLTSTFGLKPRCERSNSQNIKGRFALALLLPSGNTPHSLFFTKLCSPEDEPHLSVELCFIPPSGSIVLTTSVMWDRPNTATARHDRFGHVSGYRRLSTGPKGHFRHSFQYGFIVVSNILQSGVMR